MSAGDAGAARAQRLRAIAMMMAGMITLPAMDAIAKYLALTYAITAAQTVFFRFSVQALVLGAVLLTIGGLAALRPRYLTVNLVRGAVMSIAVMMFFAALKHMPLADALAIFFTEPLILTVMSAVLLGERFGRWRLGAILLGFAGAMLIIRPGFADFGVVALFPLVTATLFALYLIITRKFAPDDDPVAMQFVSGLGGAAMIATVMPLGTMLGLDSFGTAPLPVTIFPWFLLLLIGLIAAGGHLIVVYAFQRAPASLLAPFQYIEIISAVLLGWLVFADFPDGLTWLGIAIIVASGLTITWRESVRGD